MRGTGVFSPPKRPALKVTPKGEASGDLADRSEIVDIGLPKYWLGVILVVSAVLLWVGSSFLTKTIMKSFKKPWFLSYLSMISSQIFYIFRIVRDPIFDGNRLKRLQHNDTVRKDEALEEPKFVGGDPKTSLPPFTFHELARIASFIFLIYTTAVYLCNLSFQHTSVTSSMIMATTNGIFLLFFGLAFGTDQVALIKLLAVSLSAGGAFILVFGELSHGEWRLTGNLMSLGSSTLYSLYSILLKKMSGGDVTRLSFPLLLALMGSACMLTTWPLFILLHLTAIEPFIWPYDLTSWASILFNTIFGFLLPAYLWTAAATLTSPLVVAVGMSCTVPVTLVFELMYSKEVQWYSVVAGVLVVAGFLMMNNRTICTADSESDAKDGCCGSI